MRLTRQLWISGAIIAVFSCALMTTQVFAQTVPVAQTPPMGWNDWYQYKCTISDAIVRANADALVSTGMKAAGYTYISIDDCWQGTRDAQGNIQPNSRFPDMKALADYVHSKGLKFGIYSSPGPKTCAGYEGSYGHEEQDARTYATNDVVPRRWNGSSRSSARPWPSSPASRISSMRRTPPCTRTTAP